MKRILIASLLALVVAAVSPATASAASTLTGENLSGASSSGNSLDCPNPTYSVTGTATVPYPGTFTETGTWDVDTLDFSATFTITSGTTTITGSKAGNVSPGTLSCGPLLLGNANVTGVPYAATIRTPNGNFHDEGTSTVVVEIIGSAATLTESFTSSLTAPTSKDQCKNNGWKAFPQFKNQGQCVSFVERQGRT